MSKLDKEHEMFKLQGIIEKKKERLKLEKSQLVLSKKDHNKQIKIDFPLTCEDLERIRYRNMHCETMECNSDMVGDRFERYLRDLHKTCDDSVKKDIELEHSIEIGQGYLKYDEGELQKLKSELKQKK